MAVQLRYKLPKQEIRHLPFEPSTTIQVIKDYIQKEGQITTPFKLRVYVRGVARYLKPEWTLAEVDAMEGGVINVNYVETASNHKERLEQTKKDRPLTAFLAQLSACEAHAATEQLRRVFEIALQILSPTELSAILTAANTNIDNDEAFTEPPEIKESELFQVPAKRCHIGGHNVDDEAIAPEAQQQHPWHGKAICADNAVVSIKKSRIPNNKICHTLKIPTLGDPIQIGTDCSGIEAPIQALENIGVKFTHLFSSDIDRHVRAMISANFGVAAHHIYEDITKRDHSQMPRCDVYVAGWPCQGNSAAGKRKGFADPRSQVFYSVVAYISRHKPRVVILENVANVLKVNDGKDFQIVLSELSKAGSYNIAWNVLNTNSHGVPQHRPRVYIVCIRKDIDQGTFTWPEPLGAARRPGVDRFLDSRKTEPKLTKEFAPDKKRASDIFDSKMEELIDKGLQPLRKPYLFDIGQGKAYSTPMHDTCPCLMTVSSMWISHYGRTLNLAEKCRLQGMDPRRLEVVVSDAEFAKQLGNAMSVNIIERILVAALPTAGLTPPLHDRWAGGEAVANLEASRDCELRTKRRSSTYSVANHVPDAM